MGIDEYTFMIETRMRETTDDFILEYIQNSEVVQEARLSKDDLRRALWLLAEERAGHIVNTLDYPNRQWIPVTERLPEESGFYLCSIKSYDSDNYVLFGRFSMGKFNLIDVEAWMPLPKPYKEGAEDAEEMDKDEKTNSIKMVRSASMSLSKALNAIRPIIMGTNLYFKHKGYESTLRYALDDIEGILEELEGGSKEE